MKKTVLLVLISGCIALAFCSLAAVARTEDNKQAEFTRRHLDVVPPEGWIKEKVPLSGYDECLGYRQPQKRITMVVCPVADGEEFEDMLEEANAAPTSGNIDSCAVIHKVMNPTETLLVPLKTGEGGAIIDISQPIALEKHHESLITVDKDDFTMPAILPALTQKARPVLSALKDLAIPDGLFAMQPIVSVKYEDLSKRFAANRKWELRLPQGWRKLPLDAENIGCMDGGLPLTFGQYLDGNKNALVSITVCKTGENAAEIARSLYAKSKRWPEGYRSLGEFTDKRVEKNGSWQLEQSGGQLKSIFYITEDKGLYSLIQIIGNDAASLEHGKRLLEQLKTDTPALFPKEY